MRVCNKGHEILGDRCRLCASLYYRRWSALHRQDRAAYYKTWAENNPANIKNKELRRTAAAVADLSSKYVKTQINIATGIPTRLIPAEMVAAKRAQMRVNRLLKEMNK